MATPTVTRNSRSRQRSLADATVENDPSPRQLVCNQQTERFVCDLCFASFSSKSGLGVHRSSKHRLQANSDAKPSELRPRWSKEESLILAKREAELSLEGCRFINQALVGFLPGRSFESVKCHRKQQHYRTLVRNSILELHSSQEVIEAPSQAELTDSPRRSWLEDESTALASLEVELPSHRGRWINIDLAKHFPHRSVEAIRCHRKTAKYKSLLATVQEASVVSSFIPNEGAAVLGQSKVHDVSSVADSTVPDLETFVIQNDISGLAAGRTDGKEKRSALSVGTTASCIPELRDALSLFLADKDLITSNPDLRTIIDCALSGEDCMPDVESFLKKTFPDREKRLGGPPGTIHASSGRAQRRARYAKFQDLFKKDRKKCASFVFDGEAASTTYSAADFHKTWAAVFASQPKIENLGDIPAAQNTISAIWKPIALGEIVGSKLQSRTAAGPDGVSATMLKKVDPRVLLVLFNVFLIQMRIPKYLNRSITTFIPKSANPTDASDFRPISVTSVLLRTFHKILAARLRDLIPWDDRQRAFLPTDGCFKNTFLSQTILKHSHSTRHPLYLSCLDLRKAFDSVSHQAAIRALTRFGCPQEFLTYYEFLLSCGSTFFIGSDGISAPVDIACCVRQGDPLSPYVFNAVIDEFLSSLSPGIGFEMENTTHSAMGFADDLNLFSSSQKGLQSQIDIATTFFRKRNLYLNPEKCRSLAILRSGKRKKTYIDRSKTFLVEGAAIPTLGPTHKWTYLEVSFDPYGNTSADVSKLGELLQALKSAPLKPQQRLVFLTDYLVPRFVHGLTLSDFNVPKLNGMDRCIRRTVKAWFKFPTDLPTPFFYQQQCGGGLGIPSLRWTIPRLQLGRLWKLPLLNSRFFATLTETANFIRKLRSCERLFLSGTSDLSDRTGYVQYWHEKFCQANDGVGLRHVGECPDAFSWIGDGSTLMRDSLLFCRKNF